MQTQKSNPRLFLRRNWWLVLLVAVQLAVLVFRFAADSGSGQTITLTGGRFTPYYGDTTTEQDSIILHGTADTAGTPQVFAFSDKFDLYAGSYQVVLEYESVGGGTATYNFAYHFGGGVPGLTFDTITLDPAASRATAALQLQYDMLGEDAVYLRVVGTCGAGQSIRLHSVQLVPNRAFAVSRFVSALVLLALLDWLLLVLLRRLPFPLRQVKARYSALFLLGVVILACLPLGLNYMITGHDLSVHLNRIELLAQTLRGGQFPARLYPTAAMNKGYPFGIMYPDLFLYPFAVLRLLGFALDTCYKAYLVCITAATALITRFCLRRMFNSETVALAGSGLYLLSFYRLTNTLVRGAVGEYTAMAFLPLIVYGLWALYTQPRGNQKSTPWCWVPLALGFTGVLQSHMLSTLMAGLFTAVFCLLFIRRTVARPVLTGLCKAAGAAAAWNLWYLVPFLQFYLTKSCAVSVGTSNPTGFLNTAAFPTQIFTMFGEAGHFGVDLKYGFADDMPLSVGTVLGLAALLMLAVLLDPALRRRTPALTLLGTLSLGLGALSAWMCCCTFPWMDLFITLPRIATFFENFQFTWRFLVPATLFFTLAGCVALWLLPQRLGDALPGAGGALAVRLARAGLAALLLVLTVIPAGQLAYSVCMESPVENHLSAAGLQDRVSQVSNGEYLPAALYTPFYDENGDLIDRGDIYNNAWAVTTPTCDPDIDLAAFSTAPLSNTITAANTATQARAVRLPLFCYAGYHISGDSGALLGEDTGFVSVTLPAGWSGTITVAWSMPWFWRVADLFSLAACCATVVLYRRSKKGHAVQSV